MFREQANKALKGLPDALATTMLIVSAGILIWLACTQDALTKTAAVAWVWFP